MTLRPIEPPPNATAAQIMARPRTPEQVQAAYRDFTEEILPMQQAVARALAPLPRHYIIPNDPAIPLRAEYADSEAVERLLATLDEFVKAAARRHGFEVAD